MKQKDCRQCGETFAPFQSFQKVCGPVCAVEYAKVQTEKKNKADARRALRRLRESSKPHQLRLTQLAFNRMIRARDSGLPCISCGRNTGAKMNAGHYLTVGGHPALRFEPDNCHLQCEHCNSHLSGNIARYRIGLIEKIGLERVEWLEGPHEAKHYTAKELIEMRAEINKRTREMEK